MNGLNPKTLWNDYKMSDSNEADGDIGSGRFRSPSFSDEEITVLLDLIDRYKNIILNKSTTATANSAKDKVWAKIAKEFNSHCLSYVRSPDCLRTKWENLKRDTKRIPRKALDVKVDFNTRVLSVLSESQNISGTLDLDAELIDLEVEDESAPIEKENSLDEFPDKQSEDSDRDDEIKRRKRTSNFLPVECNILLKCVREEKKYVFNSDISCKAVKLKNRAWLRIAEAFNKQSPRKRNARVLRTKFENMKKLSGKINTYFKQTRVKKPQPQAKKLKLNEPTQVIKSEPLFEDQIDVEAELDESFDVNFQTDDSNLKFIPDPLATVLSSDSGTGSLIGMDTWNQPENKEVVKLKLELLKYQLETAKLERKILEDSMKTETAVNRLKAIEGSMRLRTARLHAVAAEMNLPLTHPALQYTTEETEARQYISQYQNT